jgi:hypothetical protein
VGSADFVSDRDRALIRKVAVAVQEAVQAQEAVLMLLSEMWAWLWALATAAASD